MLFFPQSGAQGFAKLVAINVTEFCDIIGRAGQVQAFFFSSINLIHVFNWFYPK